MILLILTSLLSLKEGKTISSDKKNILDESGEYDININFKFESRTGKLTLTGKGPMTNYNQYSRPYHSYCSKIKSGEIGEGITNIGSDSFCNCINLLSVVIASTVTNISHDAFNGCSKLNSISFSNNINNVQIIEEYAFEKCSSLTSLPTFNNLISIGSKCFEYCDIKSIALPKTLETFPLDAFDNNNHLKSINIDENNKYFKSIDGVLFLKNESKLILYPFGKEDRFYEIPDGTISIGEESFKNGFVYVINISDSVVSLDPYALYECNVLYSLNIGRGLEKIADTSIYNCYKIANITVDENNAYFKSINGILFSKDESELIKYPTQLTEATYVIPLTVTTIKYECFFNNRNLKKIIITDNVSFIDQHSIRGCGQIMSFEVTENNQFFATFDDILYLKNFTRIVSVPFKKAGNYTLHENLTRFENELFSKRNIKYINIPNKITYINTNTFNLCEKLQSIIIPDSVTIIDYGAFINCYALQSVEIGKNVRWIGSSAFNSCKMLKSITIPKLVSNISSNLFYGCVNLTSVTFCGNINYIDVGSFGKCYSLSSMTYYGSIITDHFKTDIFKDCKNLTNVTVLINYEIDKYCGLPVVKLPDGYARCGENIEWFFNSSTKIIDVYGSGYMYNSTYKTFSTFHPIRNLVNVVNVGEGINSIGDLAFYYMTQMTTINLPESLEYIGINAFYSCKNLRSIKLSDKITVFKEYAFTRCYNLTELNIPKSLVTIEQYALSETGLYSLSISDNVVSLGPFALANCINISSITIGNGIKSIEYQCLYECQNLSTLNIGENVEKIGYLALAYCKMLEVLVLPEKLTMVDVSSFSNCHSLRNITFLGPINSITENLFRSCYALDTIIFNNTAQVNDTVIIPDNIDSINPSSFYNCYSIKHIRLGKNVSSIEPYAFTGCTGLISIELNEAVSSIGEKSFQYCISLTSFEMNDNIEVINPNTFSKCSNLTSVKFNERLTIIGDNSFSECYSLKSVKIPDSVIMVNISAFSYCTGMEALVLGQNLTSIGNYAFRHCSNLTNITIPRNLISINDRSFEYCDSIESINVLEGNPVYLSYDGVMYTNEPSPEIFLFPLKKKGHLMFHPNMTSITSDINSFSSSNITSITFGEKTTYIDSFAFQYFINLESIKMENVVTISIMAFTECPKLKTVVFSEHLKSIGSGSFKECVELTTVNYTGSLNLSNCLDIFTNCAKLKYINVLENFQYDTFCGINVSKCIIFVPETPSIEITTNNEGFIESSNVPIISNPTHEPIITDVPIPVQTPMPENISFIDIPNDINEEKLNDILLDKFDSMGDDESILNVVVINNDENSKKVPYNSTLKPNQYIKLGENTNIDLNGGNLNIILPENRKATVSINNDKDNKISIRGDGDLGIEFQPESKSKSININSNSEINGSLTITVPDDTESFEIDSIDLSSKSSIKVKKEKSNEVINFAVKKLTATYNTIATISNVTIKNSLKVHQTATLNVDNITFDNAVVEYEIFNYNNKNLWKEPFFKGNFNQPPNSLILKESIANELPTVNSDYTLISGLFDIDGCGKWLNIIDITNTHLNEKKCEDNALLSTENKRIVIRNAKQDDDGNNNDNKKKLNGGQIAGIVIGCIAGVAIIVVVIIIIIKKTKKSSNSTSEDANPIDNGNDL